MEIGSTILQTSQNNSAAAAATAGAAPAQRPENSTQQVTPTKESADPRLEQDQTFGQDRLIRDAFRKDIITGEREIFNFRVTRYENNLTFTNIITGNVTSVAMQDVVGSSAIDAAI